MQYPYWNPYNVGTPGSGMPNTAPSAPTYSPFMPPQQQAPTQVNTFYYVNGREGAKAFSVAPNAKVLLMDSDNPIFYLKEANDLGQASIRAFRFEEMKDNMPGPGQTADMQKELEDLKAKVAKIEETIAGEVK